MTTLDTLYERLYHRLEAICKECNDIAQEMSSLKGKWEDRVEYNQEELGEQKKIIQKQETTLLAYIMTTRCCPDWPYRSAGRTILMQ